MAVFDRERAGMKPSNPHSTTLGEYYQRGREWAERSLQAELTKCIDQKTKELHDLTKQYEDEIEGMEEKIEKEGYELSAFTSLGTIDDYWQYFRPPEGDEEFVAGKMDVGSWYDSIKEDLEACVSEDTKLITDEFLEQKFGHIVGELAETETQKNLIESVAEIAAERQTFD